MFWYKNGDGIRTRRLRVDDPDIQGVHHIAYNRVIPIVFFTEFYYTFQRRLDKHVKFVQSVTVNADPFTGDRLTKPTKKTDTIVDIW